MNPLLFEKGLEFVHQDAFRHRDQRREFEDDALGKMIMRGATFPYIGENIARQHWLPISKLKQKRCIN